jgi:small basic protein (TIGR04137 family)
MSIHKSLKVGGAVGRGRNVYTRAERMEILLREGRLKPGESVLGLPKTRVAKLKKKGKKKSKDEEAETT